MNLSYCEVCGVLIQEGEGPILLPEGVICATCFRSRRAQVTQPTMGEIQGGVVQFECCYCNSLLRLKTVSKRTRVRCPKCSDAFYLHEDGRIEARLEGSKTAVLQQDDVAPLTKVEKPGEKTQPIKRSEALEFARQQQLLDELKPKNLDFVDSLPQRQHEVEFDTSRYRQPGPAAPTGGALDLVPDDHELQLEGDRAEPEPELELRPSDEGQVDLDARALKQKTRKLRRQAPRPKKKKKPRPAEAGAPLVTHRSQDDDPVARKERDRRAKESHERGAREERKAVLSVLLWLCFLLPTGAGLCLGVAGEQGQPFMSQGRFGRGLTDLGRRLEDGVRSLNTFLPAAVQLPLPEREDR